MNEKNDSSCTELEKYRLDYLVELKKNRLFRAALQIKDDKQFVNIMNQNNYSTWKNFEKVRMNKVTIANVYRRRKTRRSLII